MKCYIKNCNNRIPNFLVGDTILMSDIPDYYKWKGKIVCKRCYDELEGMVK